MQMGEASEHRPGDYGRWESSLWSPWHQGSHFGGSLSPTGAGGTGGRRRRRRMDRALDVREREKEGGDEVGGRGREERVMVSFPHMRHRLTPPHPSPKKKKKGGGISL